MSRTFKKTAVLTAAAAMMLAVGSAGGAVAGSLVTSSQIKDNTIRTQDIANGTIQGRDIHANAIHYDDVANGAVGWYALTQWTRANIHQIARQHDTKGALAGQVQDTATIGAIGGTFGKFTETVRATKVGEMTLQPGTYLLSSSGFFDTVAADSPRTDGTHLQLAVRVDDGSDWGKDFGTCFTSAFPAGDREATCAVTRVVTVDSPTTVQVFGFGYNDDQSSTGSGTFTVATDVSAVKVG